jgi:phosphoribosyl 1,2-cyclic phosphodiesterase
MRVTFCGVRGSTPAPGADFVRYGGQTSCVAIGNGRQAPSLLLDAGTGMVNVTALLGGAPYDGSVLLGHLHWDHTQGMPFFAGREAEGSRVDVFMPDQGESAEAVLGRGMSPPHFPVPPNQFGDGWSFTGLTEGSHEIEGFRVLAREIPHKGGRTFGYRVERAGASLAYLSDHSPTALGPGPDGWGERHEAAMALADGVDLLIHDAQHLGSEFPAVDFLGHASIEYAVALAREAGARTLALFHHSPWRTDDEVDEIVVLARRLATGGPAVLAAHEGLVLDLHDATTG